MEVIGPMDAIEHGVVLSFDEDAGYGQVASDESVERFFHCTAIASGSRTIPVGAVVTFSLEPGRLGRWEAAHLVRC